MARPTKRTPELIDAILEGLGEGLYENAICEKLGVDPSNVRIWKRKDAELREKFTAARVDGIFARLEADKKALEEAQTRDEILKADKCLAHSRWEAEKLVKDFQPVQKSEVTHNGPMVIGWEQINENNEEGQVIPDQILNDITPEDVAN